MKNLFYNFKSVMALTSHVKLPLDSTLVGDIKKMINCLVHVSRVLNFDCYFMRIILFGYNLF